jgi:hypothetical protein
MGIGEFNHLLEVCTVVSPSGDSVDSEIHVEYCM